MPTTYTGSKEDRLKRLEKNGQRCNGVGNRCIQTATAEFLLMPVDPKTGLDQPDAKPFTRKSCGRHRAETSGKADVRPLDERRIPPRALTNSERRTAAKRTTRMRSLIGCTFFTEPNGFPLIVERVRFIVDDVLLTDQHGGKHWLNDVHRVKLTSGHNEAAHTTADADGDQTESTRRVSVPTFSG